MHDAAPKPADLFVRGGTLLTPQGATHGDLLIIDGRISAIGASLNAPAGVPELDAKGKLAFPGLIDPQVHFREPGWTHKEDIASGSLSAIAGGVTCFMEMPNTVPTTTDPAALEDKLRRSQGRAWADHAYFLGATAENADRLGEWEQAPGCAGIKVFMGSSTGSLLVADDATLERVLRSGSRRVAVHSEHEPRLRERYAALDETAVVREHHTVRDVACAVMATERLLRLAEKTGRKIHLLHVSTADEVAMLRERDLGDLVTAEVTPNHLFLSAPGCYEHWGSLAQMNPPVRTREHQEALRTGLRDGILTCIGSDHAPHHLREKARPYPQSPSGIPGVQTILPLLLTAVEHGWLSLSDVVRVTASGPAQVYGIQDKGALEVGADGDLALVDPAERGPLPLEWLRSRAGFSPYVGMRLSGWPTTTVLRGRVVYDRHRTVGIPGGAPLRFASTA